MFSVVSQGSIYAPTDSEDGVCISMDTMGLFIDPFLS